MCIPYSSMRSESCSPLISGKRNRKPVDHRSPLILRLSLPKDQRMNGITKIAGGSFPSPPFTRCTALQGDTRNAAGIRSGTEMSSDRSCNLILRAFHPFFPAIAIGTLIAGCV